MRNLYHLVFLVCTICRVDKCFRSEWRWRAARRRRLGTRGIQVWASGVGDRMIVGAGVRICMAAVDMRRHDRRKGSMVAQDVVFRNGELEIKDVQELALDAAHITLAKHTGAERPVDIFESRVIEILACHHDCAKKDALACPFFEGDLEMRFCSIDVDERDKDGWDGDLCTSEDVMDKGDKGGMFGAARVSTTAARGRGAIHGVIDCVYDSVDDIFDDLS